ncbi:hypothetical protein MITS9509_03487 [Synechococcus sp. MIT S9509]|uniref:helix-turn-helix domain-containing protein n=1 Tax=Synechococcus sp. MIT S9509 TaxID=1801630 RepID=UPI0007BC4776|nr:helix-turn-helix transcriptional regulator [Synechococcus sp. MIT S9509]KZR86248.1 hypothetical protein MITS9509_03487 [Synechococcus sp. MIT S9509]
MADEHGLRSSLGQLMAVRRITVKKLCQDAGVHPAAVTKLRRNQFMQLDAGTLERICRCLEIDIADMLYFDPPIKEEES